MKENVDMLGTDTLLKIPPVGWRSINWAAVAMIMAGCQGQTPPASSATNQTPRASGSTNHPAAAPKDDSIDRLVQRLSRGIGFRSGPIQPLYLPADASAKDLLSHAMNRCYPNKPPPAHIIESRNVFIGPPGNEAYKAILFSSPEGKMILLTQYTPLFNEWWSHLYDQRSWE
jgi:hypothetical protein